MTLPAAPAVFGEDDSDVDPRAVLSLWEQREFRDLVRVFLRVLLFYEKHPYEEIGPEVQERIDRFVGVFLFIMSQPDLRIPNDLAPLLVSYSHIIANVVEISAYRTTDPQIRMLMHQKGNFVKILALYSPRNTVRLDMERFFAAEPRLASLWYTMSPIGRGGSVDRTSYENLRDHVAKMDERFIVPDERIAPMYFLSTYYCPGGEAPLKRRFNEQIQARMSRLPIDNRPDPLSIAIVSEKWFPQSAVYRSSYPFIERLTQRYRLTLVHLGPPRPNLDTSLFAQPRNVVFRSGTSKLEEVLSNDFQMVYYADIGMNPESVWLSNLRLAPIQAVGYGHPVSTFGSQIDYFIGGMDVELAEDAEKNYSERLVLIPGIGAHPVYPDYTPQRPTLPAEPVTINCSWGYAKINYPMIVNLRAIQKRARRPVRYQFFPSWSLANYNATVPFRREIYDVFGDTAVVIGNQRYDVYMQFAENAHLSIDSYPFGGYNTIVDSLHLARPVVTYEGTRFANRAASALLRRLDLDELVAHSDEEYIEKTVRLVDDEDYRNQLSQRLVEMDLRTRLYDTNEPEAFARAIDFLMEHHDRLRRDTTRSPIFIQ